MNKYSKPITVAIMMMVFATWFLHNTKSDLPLIFQKDLHAHDESSNSVVAANITRKFFPPMVRINPLNLQQGNWMEGPFWQHIPPLFAYVPYIFFQLDGHVTIEVKRLSYALVTLLTGWLFIFAVYKYKNSLLAAAAATVAGILWINTPFTHELITGYAFGVSDIVLAFTMVGAFAATIWYLRVEDRLERARYPAAKLIIIGLLVALPILAKSLLGAIPSATYFIFLAYDHRQFNKKVLLTLLSYVGLLALYFLPLLFSSPATFQQEILVPLLHWQNLEGWGRPWHFYLTNYLPQRYLFGWTIAYYLGLIAVAADLGYSLFTKRAGRPVRITLAVSFGWFVSNLFVISIVQSKIPNFIYQTYLLSLYAIVYTLGIRLVQLLKHHFVNLWELSIRYARSSLVVVVCVLVAAVALIEAVRFADAVHLERAQAYSYTSEHEKFYQVAEWLQANDVSATDLTIVRVSDNDCWFRYYVLFLTGAESKTLLEMNFMPAPGQAIKDKYHRLFMIVKKDEVIPADLPSFQRIELANYSLIEFNLRNLTAIQIQDLVAAFVQAHQRDIQSDILRIKTDLTACQWLVPDSILNAP